jgi:hypothetical protein
VNPVAFKGYHRATSLEWTDVPGILTRIHAPEFQERNFDVITYGAKGDGVTDSLPANRQHYKFFFHLLTEPVLAKASARLINGLSHHWQCVNDVSERV